jgi:Flp pilus assembly protein TadD
MLASDHGFLWKEGRPTALSSNATATAAKWHRKEGIYLLWGEGLGAADGHRQRGSVQQVCSTLLALVGLPPGRGLEGQPLAPVAAPQQATVDYQARYQPTASAAAVPSAADQDTLAKLKSLGYIGGDRSAAPAAGNGTRTPASFNNEGLILRDAGKTNEAIAAFERALALDPDLASAAWNLSDMLFAGGDRDRADDLLLKAFSLDLPEAPRYLANRASAYQKEGHADRALKLVNAALQAKPGNVEVLLFRGRYRVDTKDCTGAVDDFRRVEQLSAKDAGAYALEGVAQTCAGDRAGAVRAFQRSLQLDPNQPDIRELLKALGRTS